MLLVGPLLDHVPKVQFDKFTERHALSFRAVNEVAGSHLVLGAMRPI